MLAAILQARTLQDWGNAAKKVANRVGLAAERDIAVLLGGKRCRNHEYGRKVAAVVSPR